MKKLYVITFFSILTISSFAQHNRHQIKIIVNENGREIKHTVTEYGIQFTHGTSLNFYDKSTKDFIPNYRGSSLKCALYYREFFLDFGYTSVVNRFTEQLDTLFFTIAGPDQLFSMT